MGRNGRPTPTRCAYTLIEMLIVLAVLAVLAALSWPAVRGMLGKSELRDAAKQVRVALARARLGAIESGAARGFRYRPGSGRFEVGPLSTALDESESLSPSARERPSRHNEPAEAALPRGVWFADSRGSPSGAEAAASSGRADDSAWSARIVFFPNGRSNSARIRLAGSGGFQVEVTLRGLTGTTQIGPLERIEQRP